MPWVLFAQFCPSLSNIFSDFFTIGFGNIRLFLLLLYSLYFLEVAYTGAYFNCIATKWYVPIKHTFSLKSDYFYLISVVQLIAVGVLGLAILFLYAVFSFIFLHSFYDRNADLYCNTLLECYFSVIRVGLLDTLGVSITV